MVFSNLDSLRHCPSIHCTRSNPWSDLGWHSRGGWYRPVHDRECSGDRFNRVQDLQGVPGSQDQYLRWPNFNGHSEGHTSTCYIHTN